MPKRRNGKTARRETETENGPNGWDNHPKIPLLACFRRDGKPMMAHVGP